MRNKKGKDKVMEDEDRGDRVEMKEEEMRWWKVNEDNKGWDVVGDGGIQEG